VRALNTRIITTNSKKFKTVKKRGRIGCQKAWLIKNDLYKIAKFEHINTRISVAKLNLTTKSHAGIALIGCYLCSNNNKNHEYEHDLAVIQSTYARLCRDKFKVIITGDFNGDSGRCLYLQDVILSNWLSDNHKKELTRLYTQPIPFTFLGAIGQTSFIDHFIIDQGDEWSEIEQVNVITSKAEYRNLKETNDPMNEIKGIWDWANNHGDHRGIKPNTKGENCKKKGGEFSSKTRENKLELYDRSKGLRGHCLRSYR
jgi:hypothetical protein